MYYLFYVFYSFVIDPYGVLAMLGFLVFLFYIIYNYLNATGNASVGRHFGIVKRSTNHPKVVEPETLEYMYNLRENRVIDVHNSVLNSIRHYDNMNS